MAIFLVDTWIPVKGKEKKNEDVIVKILQYGAKHPEVFKYVKSLRYFKQSIGGQPPGRRILITEFSSLSGMEAFFKEISAQSEWQKIYMEWTDVMDKEQLKPWSGMT